MSWKGVTIMDQRVRFISEYLNNYFFFNELCKQFEISRKTGYKWIGRYKELGPEGLKDQSRKPVACPHKTDSRIINAIKSIRLKHPQWGTKKLLVRLEKRYPDWIFPNQRGQTANCESSNTLFTYFNSWLHLKNIIFTRRHRGTEKKYKPEIMQIIEIRIRKFIKKSKYGKTIE